MPTKRMLIDAAHPEETRVVVLNGNKLEELDVESSNRKQLKGNIYLAKVARVEPSLQAAFVEYGGNRHGFLPFSEIHPDYYQIPVADREALIEQERGSDNDDDESVAEGDGGDVKTLGGDDDEEVRVNRTAKNLKNYKIQEVIKRRQVILVQVVKEERGNKGAAMTTYLSLAGRYCVLMPNTPRGGGISRKISNTKDRRRLRTVLGEMGISDGMAVIVRTAGAERSRAEIRRDYDYLIRLWSNVRDTTLESTAPSLVHEEGNLIKRSIRDLYNKEIEEVVVEGDEGYRTAKDFMKMLVPSHSKKVQPYREQAMPLFHRYQVEGQLDAMHSPVVQLRSGGYIVINPTEALVSIDVNSGRATRERNIEETALRTNLEAAEEIARQLRLRDLAGLVVIDFIDMEGSRNQSSVERKLKEAMRSDQARIQIGRISPFGLLEMSRQRLRPSFLETSTETCIFCQGSGVRRSIESTVLHMLRAFEEEGIRRRTAEMTVSVPTDVAFYLLNQKRPNIIEMESRYDFVINIVGDDSLVAPDFKLERTAAKSGTRDVAEPVSVSEGPAEETRDEEEGGRKRKRRRRSRRRKGDPSTEMVETETTTEDAPSETPESEGEDDGEDQPRKKRRRGKRGGRRRRRAESDTPINESGEETAAAGDAGSEVIEIPIQVTDAVEQPLGSDSATDAVTVAEPAPEEKPKRTRRRRKKADPETATEATAEAAPATEDAPAPATATPEAPADEAAAIEKPKRRRRRRKTEDAAAEAAAEPTVTAATDPVAEPEPKPKRRTRRKKVEDPATETVAEDATVAPASEEQKPKPRRRTRRKKTEDAAPAGEAAPKAVPAPAPEPAPTPATEAPQPAAPPAAGVTVTNSDGSSEAVSKPKTRKGWWNR